MGNNNILMEINNPEKKDLLEREGFHKSLAEIMNWQDNEKNGFVVGLYGSWGSGKSFSIDKSLEILENDFKEKINECKNSKQNRIKRFIKLKRIEKCNMLTIKFNPWYFTETDDLILNFFKCLSESLKTRQSILENIKDWIGKIFGVMWGLVSSIDKYLEKMSPEFITLNPILTITVTIGKIITKCLSVILKGYRQPTDIVTVKKKLDKKFENLPFRILVIMDDMDRLNDREIGQILHLVKCLADFKNITYVLSFDEKIVSNALENHQNGYGMHYLEKIIQFPIKMPEPHTLDLENILEEEIKNIIGENPRDIPQYFEFYPLCFSNMIKNIRDVNRYISIFNFNWNLLKNQVNKIDLIVLTALQVFTPEIYDWVKHNKELFVGYSVFDGTCVLGGSGYDHKYYKNKINEYLKNYRSIDADDVYQLLTVLFPNSAIKEFAILDTRDGNPENRIYGENSFNNYFMYCKSEHEFQTYELELYKKQGLTEKDFEGFLHKLSKSDRLERYILKLQNNGNSLYRVPPKNRTIIANGLIYSLEHVKHYSKKYISGQIVRGLHDLFSPTSDDLIMNTHILINSLKKSNDSYLVIDEIIRRSKNKNDRLTDVYSPDELINLDFEYLENNKLVEIINELYTFDEVKHFETIEAILSGINKEQMLFILENIDHDLILDCMKNVKDLSGVNIGATLTLLKKDMKNVYAELNLREITPPEHLTILTGIDDKSDPYINQNAKYLHDINKNILEKYSLLVEQYLASIAPFNTYQKFKEIKYDNIKHEILNIHHGNFLQISKIISELNEPECGFLISGLSELLIKEIASHLPSGEGPKLYEKITRIPKLRAFTQLDEISIEKINLFIENTYYYKNPALK
ncbi:KAP P-loop domain protein [Methanococcus vannielii SB]|uniref:KAP P-loop domain protein n=1 Tax=Methanococcus vannielii (strain ATCC 35089 / DSM 1224 / JCM 13029 / OCM 148 / SB) TaxID=406327 RepID=A6USQ9_METVS|nr:KAP P-loop domain-containing protein [Methanococcus vannielii]ABR55531.1 KAP P-loop domain protein [Methanococcus vannielii SB]